MRSSLRVRADRRVAQAGNVLPFVAIRRTRKAIEHFAGGLLPIRKRLGSPFLPVRTADHFAEPDPVLKMRQHRLQRFGGVGFPAGRKFQRLDLWHVGVRKAELLDTMPYNRRPARPSFGLGKNDNALIANLFVVRLQYPMG